MVGFVRAKGCVVAVAVTVGVDVLTALLREGVLCVRPAVVVPVWTTEATAFRGRAGLVRTVVAVRSTCLLYTSDAADD